MPSEHNPPNSFARVHCAAEGAPEAAHVRVTEERARSILTRNDSPDIPYRWSVNPYRGCAHGCAYCYARRTHEYLDLGAGSDFDCRLMVKVNAPELLDAALSRPRWGREHVAFSGVTDCYQPLEAEYRLTRRCLEVCSAHANPVGVVTKSDLVVRDVDVLLELGRRSSAPVLFSIPHADESTAGLMEPGAPPPVRRFAAMQKLAAAGVPVGLILAPVIPGLNDRDIPVLLARAAECGATSVSYTPVRLPGSVADVFLDRLRGALPHTAKRVEALIRDMRDGRLNNPQFGRRMEATGPYWESVERLFETMATRYGLDGGQEWRSCERGSGSPIPKQLPLF